MRCLLKNNLVLLLFCCIALPGVLVAGCAKRQVSPPSIPPAIQSVPPAYSQAQPLSAPSFTEAEEAFRNSEMARAEQIATALTARGELTERQLPRAWRILALSAHANNHYYLALNALQGWLEADPQADNLYEWQQTWESVLAALPAHDARSRAREIVDDPERPWALRADMVLFLASLQWDAGADVDALISLLSFYAETIDEGRRISLEHNLFEKLHGVDSPVLAGLYALTSEENEGRYPYALIVLEDARRRAAYSEEAQAATEDAEMARSKSELADPGIFDLWLAGPQETGVTPLPGRSIALALPLSGQYSAIGKRVALGATAARQEFGEAGHNLNLFLIDTEVPGWLEAIAALPRNVTVVGGPLRAQSYTLIRDYGLTADRVFLTFLPTLPNVYGREEGGTAWRFFPGPQDQINALFRLTRGLGIQNYAVLMPEDAYAARMADLFENQAAAGGGRVTARSVYPADQSTWNDFTASFLHTSRNAENPPRVDYQAIFLPDSWKNMEILVPNLFYFRENRQVLLGTSLWEQGLSAQTHGDAHYYGLAAFPGPWKMKEMTPAAETLRLALLRAGEEEVDFWTGLGYDFVRFAATLPLEPGWRSEDVNALLSRHQGMAWSMAPLRWSAEGEASQELFLFTPEVDGFSTLKLDEFRRNFEQAWQLESEEN